MILDELQTFSTVINHKSMLYINHSLLLFQDPLDLQYYKELVRKSVLTPQHQVTLEPHSPPPPTPRQSQSSSKVLELIYHPAQGL